MADEGCSTKLCPRCKLDLPISAFGKAKSTKDGLTSWCMECRRAAGRAYAAKHKDEAAVRSKAWDEKNPERRRQNRSRHYQENKEKTSAQVAAWQALNKDLIREAAKLWRKVNRDRDRAARRSAANARYAANPEKTREYQREYYKRNSAIFKQARDRYNARRKNAEGSYKQADILRIFKHQSGRCAYCRCKLTARYDVDHITPLHAGGTNYPKNLQLTCGPCNSKKRAQDPIAFAQKLGLLL